MTKYFCQLSKLIVLMFENLSKLEEFWAQTPCVCKLRFSTVKNLQFFQFFNCKFENLRFSIFTC